MPQLARKRENEQSGLPSGFHFVATLPILYA